MQCVVKKGHLATLKRMQVMPAPGVTVGLLHFDVQRAEKQGILKLLHPSSSITTWLG
jgi:hypothetical protein